MTVPKCYNRAPFKDYVSVQDGWTRDGKRAMTYIPDPMSKGCHQHGPMGEATLGHLDCGDCIWRPKNSAL